VNAELGCDVCGGTGTVLYPMGGANEGSEEYACPNCGGGGVVGHIDDPICDPAPCAGCGHARKGHLHQPPRTVMRMIDGMCAEAGCDCSEFEQGGHP
jgi:hypothetical protein